MALLGPFVGYCAYRLACGKHPSHTRRVACGAFAGFCAVVASAAGCAEQLALSGTAPLATIFPALVGVHALVAVGEAVITALVVASVLRLRPELLEHGDLAAGASFSRAALGYGLGLASIVAVLLAPTASVAPDALGRVATQLGFQVQRGPALSAPLTDYRVPGLGGGALAVAMAAVFGTLVMFGLCWLLALALAPRRRAPAPRSVSALEASG
jgi:cobalt/nickel transport system permease protein